MTAPDLVTQLASFERVVLERDAALAATVLHPDYALLLVVPEPAAIPRERWLEVLPDYLVASYAVQTQRVDVHADCATVLQRVDMTASVLGEDRSGIFVISDIWLREADGWRVWRRHSTPLAAGRLPGTV